MKRLVVLCAVILTALLLAVPAVGCQRSPTASDNTPLTIHIDQPRPETGIDYSKTLLTVVGTVSHPEATVTVNEIKAEVSEDGRFSAQIQFSGRNGIITVVAMLGEEVSRVKAVFISDPEGAKPEIPEVR